MRKKTLCSTISLSRTLRSPNRRLTRLGDLTGVRTGAGTLRDWDRVTDAPVQFYDWGQGTRNSESGESKFKERSLQMLQRLLVLGADLVHQIGIHHDAHLQPDVPGLGVGFGIVDRDADIEMPEVRPADFLADFGCGGEHASVPIDPGVVAQAD